MDKTKVSTFGRNLPVSKKHAIAICDFIKGKTIEQAIEILEKVRIKKIAVPMKGELPHRKGNIERGRYPVKASLYFIKLLKSLKGNASAHNLEADTIVIKLARADKGETPSRMGRRGRMGKRIHVFLVGEGKEAKEKKKQKEGKQHQTETEKEIKEIKEMREKPTETEQEKFAEKEIEMETRAPSTKKHFQEKDRVFHGEEGGRK